MSIFFRIWDSPTFMTWGSFLSKSLNFVLVLPLLVTRFSTEEISLWFLFMIFIGLQLLVDIGFSPTFVRVIAYAMGGARVSELKTLKLENPGKPDWSTMEQICSTMRFIYPRINVLWTAFLVIIGTQAVYRPLSLVEDRNSAWIAWGVILAASTMTMWGNFFSSYLQGINKVALFRRWEMITSLGSITTSVSVLLLGGGILGMVIANQGWLIINIFRNRWLARWVEKGRLKQFTTARKNREVFDTIWPSAWRSGLGILMTYGLVQASGILYAQIGPAGSVASYLLALRMIQMVSQFSQAPFYSKLPVFSRLISEGKREDFVHMAKIRMSLAHLTYVSVFIFFGLFGDPLLDLIRSNVDFPSRILWTLLGLTFFLERYGAMHLQLYSTTNDIIWHIANGVTGLIYVFTSLVLLKHLGAYAFPIGMILGYLGFYTWYSAIHSYKAFHLKFLDFESKTTLAPFGIFLVYNIGLILTVFSK